MGVKCKLKKDDTVQIMAGRAKGKTGSVLKILHDRNKIIVEGQNMVKKTVRPRNENEKGEIKDMEAPLDISNVQIVCSKCGPTRIGYKVDGKDKTRICKKCGEKL